MPGLDGFEATRLIRAEEAASRATWPAPVRIVAMTASAMQGDRESCLAAGMNDYISKPTGLPELAATLGRHLNGKAPAARRGGENPCRSWPFEADTPPCSRPSPSPSGCPSSSWAFWGCR